MQKKHIPRGPSQFLFAINGMSHWQCYNKKSEVVDSNQITQVKQTLGGGRGGGVQSYLVHKKKEDLKKGILLHLYPKGKSALFPQVVMLLYITDVTTK